MNLEKSTNAEQSLEKIFESTYQEMLTNGAVEFTNVPEGVSKVHFLQWLVHYKKVLLHGSNNKELSVLEPRQANCTAKEFGNLEAVYAIADPVLPTFYAIKDQQKFTGTAQSGYLETDAGGQVHKEYEFLVSSDTLKTQPWSDGAVYILPKESFVQGHDDAGLPIDEWASKVPVTPIGKINITPADFPYFKDIKPLEERS